MTVKGLLGAPQAERCVRVIEMTKHVLFACLLAFTGCSTPEPQRAEKPSFKGMELYSWKPVGKDWHFNLLPGTNRAKTPSEKTNPEFAIVGAARLKETFAHLAKGEQVAWHSISTEVPPEMVQDLVSFCTKHDITLGRP